MRTGDKSREIGFGNRRPRVHGPENTERKNQVLPNRRDALSQKWPESRCGRKSVASVTEVSTELEKEESGGV
jgi:hypothetical protein